MAFESSVAQGRRSPDWGPLPQPGIAQLGSTGYFKAVVRVRVPETRCAARTRSAIIQWLALLFTRKICQTELTAPQGESLTHEAQHGIALPHQLVPWGCIISTPEISSHHCDQAYRIPQLDWRVQVFFFA